MLVIFKLPPLRSCYTNTVMQVKLIVVTTLHRLGRLVVNHFSFCIVKYTLRRKVAYLTLEIAGHKEICASLHVSPPPLFCIID